MPDEELLALVFEAIKRDLADERTGVRPPGSTREELLRDGFSEDAVEVLVRAAEEALDRQPT